MSESDDRRRRRLWQAGGLAVVTAMVVAVAIAVGTGHRPARLRPGAPVPGAASTRALLQGIPQSGAALGPASAPVTLVEFADLQCPVCAAQARRALPTLVSRYVRPGRLRIVLRLVSFIGPDSRRAAEMAAALGRQDRLWQFAELVFANQRAENSGYVDDAFLRAVSGAVEGADVQRALADRRTPDVAGLLSQDAAAARQASVSATPSFLLGRTGQPPRRLDAGGLDASALTGPVDRLLGGTASARGDLVAGR